MRWALARPPLDAGEERHLLLLAEDLGISTRRALALRADVETQLRPDRVRR